MKGKRLSARREAQTDKYLPLQPLLVVVEEAEAVELVLRGGGVGVALMSGFSARRWSLVQTQTSSLKPAAEV